MGEALFICILQQAAILPVFQNDCLLYLQMNLMTLPLQGARGILQS